MFSKDIPLDLFFICSEFFVFCGLSLYAFLLGVFSYAEVVKGKYINVTMLKSKLRQCTCFIHARVKTDVT